MLQRENYKYRLSNRMNTLFLCDNVGSGKSYEMLSLIAIKPTVDSIWENQYYMCNNLATYNKSSFRLEGFTNKNVTEFKCNLLVVPHNIYHQWIGYIRDSTKLSYYGIDRKDKNSQSR